MKGIITISGTKKAIKDLAFRDHFIKAVSERIFGHDTPCMLERRHCEIDLSMMLLNQLSELETFEEQKELLMSYTNPSEHSITAIE